LVPTSCASFGLSLAFPICLPCDGFDHHFLLDFCDLLGKKKDLELVVLKCEKLGLKPNQRFYYINLKSLNPNWVFLQKNLKVGTRTEDSLEKKKPINIVISGCFSCS